MSKCSACKKGELHPSKTEMKFVVGEYTFVATVPADACRKCGEAIVHIDDWGRAEQAVARWLIANGQPSGQATRFLRKVVAIQAKEIARLLDVTPETVSRWEAGTQSLPHSVWAAVTTIALDALEGKPGLRERLAGLHSTRPVDAPIVLNVA